MTLSILTTKLILDPPLDILDDLFKLVVRQRLEFLEHLSLLVQFQKESFLEGDHRICGLLTILYLLELILLLF